MDTKSPESVGLCSQRLARIRPAMQRYIDDGLYAGVSTLLARHGAVVHQEQAGFADQEAGTSMAPDTLFRVYSMTKPIAATALMTLHEEGRFQLFDPIAKYLPDFEGVQVLETDADGNQRRVAPARPPTIRDLLTHTAGFTYHFCEGTPVAQMYGEGGNVMEHQPLAQAVADLARLPLAFHPGSRWHYGVNIDVAAAVAQKLADQPFDELLRDRLLVPLGMVDTHFCVPAAKRSRVATTYGVADIAEPDYCMAKIVELYGQSDALTALDVERSSPVNLEGFARGGHGLIMSIGDYARFAQMLLNGGELEGERVLGRKTVEFMHSNHLAQDQLPMQITEEIGLPGYGFGLGSRVCMDPAATQVPSSPGEFGWGGAANTYFWVDPVEGMVGVFMAQKMTPPETPQLDFQALAYQALVDESPV
ncbi:MAG: beta-lactamase family protein [Gemmatimonadetes bacterium]|jgi:CubicO group peptidase (beta-lactamase class C family)|nr:beta-lactamase family protein [Gemmatimonadota bacterium]MBT7863516.1 beta-lactamase family protein [Gemmatimonadota bacterium]